MHMYRQLSGVLLAWRLRFVGLLDIPSLHVSVGP
jgi:hypothetical protein